MGSEEDAGNASGGTSARKMSDEPANAKVTVHGVTSGAFLPILGEGHANAGASTSTVSLQPPTHGSQSPGSHYLAQPASPQSGFSSELSNGWSSLPVHHRAKEGVHSAQRGTKGADPHYMDTWIDILEADESKVCEDFMQTGATYIQLYVRHKKAQIAAETKVGIDQLRRVYTAQVANREPDQRVDSRPDTPARALTSVESEGSDSKVSDRLDEAKKDVTPEMLENLRQERDAALRSLCRGYCSIIQKFGASMKFAVERSFYECFYIFLRELFKAHVPHSEWNSVRTHLEEIFQTHLADNARIRTPSKRVSIAFIEPAVAGGGVGIGGIGRGARAQGNGGALHHRFDLFPGDSNSHVGNRSTGVDAAARKSPASNGDGLLGDISTTSHSGGKGNVEGGGNVTTSTSGTVKKPRAQHEVMEVIEKARERKKIEDQKQREREERRKKEAAAHTRREEKTRRQVSTVVLKPSNELGATQFVEEPALSFLRKKFPSTSNPEGAKAPPRDTAKVGAPAEKANNQVLAAVEESVPAASDQASRPIFIVDNNESDGSGRARRTSQPAVGRTAALHFTTNLQELSALSLGDLVENVDLDDQSKRSVLS